MNATIQINRWTNAEWIAANPILVLGEFGLATDTGVLKLGDGTTHWNDLRGFRFSPIPEVGSVLFVGADGTVQGAIDRIKFEDVLKRFTLTNAETYVIGDVASAGAEFIVDGDNGYFYDDTEYHFSWKIYAYKNIPGGRVYSANPKFVEITSSGVHPENYQYIRVTFSAVDSADGYLALICDDQYQGWGEGDMLDVELAESPMDYGYGGNVSAVSYSIDPLSPYTIVAGTCLTMYGDVEHVGDYDINGDVVGHHGKFTDMDRFEFDGGNLRFYYTSQYSKRFRFESAVSGDFVTEFSDGQAGNTGRTVFQLGKSGNYGFQFLGRGSAIPGTVGTDTPLARSWCLIGNDTGALFLLTGSAAASQPGNVWIGFGDIENNPASHPFVPALLFHHVGNYAYMYLPFRLKDKITKYKDVDTEGMGVPPILDDVTLANQSAVIGATNFANTNVAGTYRISWYIDTSVIDAAAGMLSLNIRWNDGVVARDLSPKSYERSVNLTMLAAWGCGVIYVKTNGVSITYETVVSTLIGNARYGLYMTCERMN